MFRNALRPAFARTSFFWVLAPLAAVTTSCGTSPATGHAPSADTVVPAPGSGNATPAPIAPPASTVRHLLYIMKDVEGIVDIFDLDNHHQWVRKIQVPGTLFRGVTGHVGTGRLFFSDSNQGVVAAMDLATDRLLWQKTYTGADDCNNPDRLSVDLAGSTVYLPCKNSNRVLLLDADTGNVVKNVSMAQNPHNTYVGESGKYVYSSTRSGGPLVLWDPQTRSIAKTIGEFSSPVRPFTVDADEHFFYANLTNTLGFGVGDIETGRIVTEITQTTPAARTAYPGAYYVGMPHGDDPKSHGIALRPGTKELWFIDEGWGYLYVYDTSTMPPTHMADVPLFSDITKPWGHEHYRWITFTADGKYCYPADGSIVDADTKAVVPVTKITPSEKLIEVDFDGSRVVRVGGQSGGSYQ
jgi:DNA-binding beta-propeller fold protein YncE